MLDFSIRCLTSDFELRGEVFEIWSGSDGRTLVNPRTRMVVDTDREFDPPLSNDELLAIYDYGKGF